MPGMTTATKRTTVEEGCLQCLHYFGLFKYPLNTYEIRLFNGAKCTQHEVEQGLNRLVDAGIIFQHGSLYMIQDAPAWADERRAGNQRAAGLLSKSAPYIRVISSFPFVKALAISGSLSKNYASEEPDIDYFIITDANRLWIARTLLHLFKKLTFITGHQHYYCMNYFIDTEALTLAQRNQYAAIELVTLLPAYNRPWVEKLITENAWLHEFLPNHHLHLKTDYLVEYGKQPVKKFWEGLINMLAPAWLNRKLMKITDRKWRKKWRHASYTPEEYHQALQTEIHISKNHPDNYEKFVLDGLKQHQPQNNSK